MPSFFKTSTLTIIFIILISFNSSVMAEINTPRYISDTLVINLKDQMESPFKVVARLRSNDRVLVLQEKGKFIQVKTDNNTIGWLAKHYTTEKLPKKLLIEKLQLKIKSLESATLRHTQNTADGQEREDLITQQRTIISTLKEQITTLEKNTATENEYKDKYIELQKKYTALEEAQETFTNGTYAEELISLQGENKKLQNKQYIYFLLAGAFILALGIFLGKTPDKRHQKRLFF